MDSERRRYREARRSAGAPKQLCVDHQPIMIKQDTPNQP
jgi:hypothetical protein